MAVLKDLIVHGPSNFIDIAQFNKLKSKHLAADIGIFNKLTAIEASIDELDVGDLTAQTATVVGLLDVHGQLKTNSWTNSNIAAIEGNFLITPTLSSTDSTIDFTYNTTDSAWEVAINGEFAVNQVGADPVDTLDNAVQWSQKSKVLITGNIEKAEATYPLGTLVGYIKTAPTIDNNTGNATQIEITGLTDSLGGVEIFEMIADENFVSNNIYSYDYQNIKISLVQRYYGDSMRPIGVYMAAQGRASKSFIDIYGGAYTLHESNLDEEASTNHTSDYGGLAIPNVRIGNLRGLPDIISGSFIDDGSGTLPKGWGIYTDNGFFKGTIAASSGKIGGFFIKSSDLHHNALGDEESVWISAGTTDSAQIGGSENISNWAFTAGNKFGVTADGKLYAQGAEIAGTIVASRLIIENNDGTTYNGVAAIEGNKYFIEIKQNAADSSDSNKTYLYPTLYYNGNIIGTNDSDFIWYNAEEEITPNNGTTGGTQGRFEANYGSTYKVIYQVDEDTIVSQIITPENPSKEISKYITDITDNGISIHTLQTDEENPSGFEVRITDSRLSFFQGSTEVAYIDGNQLYITKSVVLQQMEVGSPMDENNLGGQWSWQVRQTANGNNLHLKWLG